MASLDINGDLQLATTDLKGTRSISIGPGKDKLGLYAPNMLGIEPLDYDVTRRLQAKLADENFSTDPNKTDIRISFGSYMEGNPPVEKYGDPADLANVGFRTGAILKTAVQTTCCCLSQARVLPMCQLGSLASHSTCATACEANR